MSVPPETKFIRKDFSSGPGHPGDQAIDHEATIQALSVFRRQANRQTLGQYFLGTAYDDDSPSHLIVHFAARPDVNLVSLSPIVDQLARSCRNQAVEELLAFSQRHPEFWTWARVYESYSLFDAGKLSGPSIPPAPTSVDPSDARLRRALSYWARDIAWRLHPEGCITSAEPAKQANIEGPTAISVGFCAPHQDNDGGPMASLTARFQRALSAELQRLAPAGDLSSEPTPWP